MVQPLIDEAEIRRRYARLTAGEQMPDLLAEDIVINQAAEIPDRIEQLDDGRWLILLRVSGQGTSSGVPTETQVGHLARYDEQGRLKRLDVHGEWDEARHAAAEDSW